MKMLGTFSWHHAILVEFDLFTGHYLSGNNPFPSLSLTFYLWTDLSWHFVNTEYCPCFIRIFLESDKVEGQEKFNGILYSVESVPASVIKVIFSIFVILFDLMQ